MIYENQHMQAAAAMGKDNPTLSFGLSGTADYGPGMQFLDLMKMMRPWIGHEAGKWGGMTIDQVQSGGYLDANGWVTEIPQGVQKVGTLWGWSGMMNQVDDHKGVYVLNYEGTGTFKIEGDVKILESTDGRIVFENTKGANMYLNIYATDPEKTGDYLRNFTMVAEKNLAIYEAGATFNPEWLDLVKDSRELRFMDWMKTNNSKVSTWDEAPTENGPNTGRGVSVQDMVKLANELGVDPYFNMPHLADENYIRTFATYVRDHLDPALKVRVEYSNEVWNRSFQQAQSMLQQSKSEWGVAAHLDFHAKKATEAALIWEDVFGEQADARVINVIGTQTNVPWVASRMLNPIVWKQMEPDTYVDPATVFEELGVTSYFGGAQTTDAVLRAKLIAAIKDPNIDATKYLAEQLMDANIKGSIPNIAQKLAENAAIADKYGLKMTAYEGGQHVHHSYNVEGISAEDLSLLTEFMTGFVRSAQMGTLYGKLWEVWSKVSDGAFMQFGDIGLPSKWGSWGLYNDLDDVNPRATVITDLNAVSTPWWDAKGGTQYQQGITFTGGDDADLIVGTAQEDYLVGGKGDDIFIGGAGSDGINGGEGTDMLVLKGSSKDYTLIVEGKGYRIAGTDGSDFLVNVEQISFDDDVAITLGELARKSDGSVTLPVTPVVKGLVINGTKNADVLTGGDGDDIVNANGGNDTISGLDGNDVLFGQGGVDSLDGGTGSDLLIGGAGNDVLQGGADADRILYIFGDGVDAVDGGGGIDILEIRGTAANQTLSVGWNGTAVTSLTGTSSLLGIEEIGVDLLGSADRLAYTGASAGVTVDLVAGTASGLTSLAGVTNVTGGGGSDWLSGNGQANTMNGAGGADRFVATVDDLRDVYLGGTGLDVADYAAYGTALSVNLAVGTVIVVGSGSSNATSDTLNGVDNLIGGSAGDSFIGSGWTNSLWGNGGADTLSGDGGADSLFGGDGDDVIDGGTGQDQLTGGAGMDTFIFTLTTHTRVATPDRILDFEGAGSFGGDVIDISAAAGDPFKFIGGAAFATGMSNQVRVIQIGGNTFAELDTDQDAGVEGRIQLVGLHNLSAADFIL